MSWLRFFHRRQSDAELQQELDAYLAEETADNIARGLNPEEARRQARIKLGNPITVRETLWQQNTVTTIDNLWRDVRYAARTLRRTPGFAAIAIIVMALGIGATAAMFTVVRSVLLKPLPFLDPDRLVALYEHSVDDQYPYNIVAGGIFAEWRKQNRSFSDLALLGEVEFNLSGVSAQLPEKVRGIACTWNLLPTLGVQPALGRNFTEADDRHSANATVLMSWSLWKRRFGGDPSILNQTIQLDGQPYTVIGILPAWFAYPDASTQLWTPVYHYKPAEQMNSLGAHQFQAIGRLKPGIAAAQGVADLSVITRRLHDQHLDNPFVSKAANIKPLLEDMVGDIKRPLYVLLAATGCVLLIACLNVANLLVARSAARRKELAIRAALGGGRLRLLRERLMESFLLSAAGGAFGLLLAYGAVQWLVSTRSDMSRVEAIHIDGAVAAFTAGLIVLCALFAGAISSVSTKSNQLLHSLQDSARGSSAGHAHTMLRRSLLAAEVGLTVVLLVAAGLLLKSYQHLRSSDLGCTTENVLTIQVGLPGARYKTPGPAPVNFFEMLLTRVRALPGVDGAGIAEAVPGQGYWEDEDFSVVEHPPLPQGTAQYAIYRFADPGFFAAMGIPLLRGHTFDPNRKLDQADQAIVNAAFAKQYFPNADPLGKHLRNEKKDYEIVGIVGDTRYSLADDPKPIQYYPLFSGKSNSGTLVIRSSRDVEQLALPVQRIIQDMDHDMPVSDVLTMNQLLGKSTMDQSFNATLLTAFAALSLLLAAVGLFGVLSYIAAQRTGEIGIRIALGAQREQVLRLMLMDGLRPAVIGLVLGLALSAAVTREMQSLLYETRPLDPSVFALVGLVLLLVATLACLIPAWRASRLDPMQALRAE
jgi:predicted permease